MRSLALTLLLLALTTTSLGCSKPERIEAPDGTPIHTGDQWFAFRGAELHLTPEQARARDAAISEDVPPETLDNSVLRESAAIFRQICSACHGRDGTPPDPMPDRGPPPRAFGATSMRMGYFFGGDKLRRKHERFIRDGGPPAADGTPSRMPAWGRLFSNEQRWGLVRYLESL